MKAVEKRTIDLDDPTSLIDQAYLGCTQRDAVSNKDLIQSKCEFFIKITTCDTSGAVDKVKTHKAHQMISSNYDMEGHAEPWERYCELPRMSMAEPDKIAAPCTENLQLSKDDSDTVGELAERK